MLGMDQSLIIVCTICVLPFIFSRTCYLLSEFSPTAANLQGLALTNQLFTKFNKVQDKYECTHIPSHNLFQLKREFQVEGQRLLSSPVWHFYFDVFKREWVQCCNGILSQLASVMAAANSTIFHAVTDLYRRVELSGFFQSSHSLLSPAVSVTYIHRSLMDSVFNMWIH